MADRLTLDDFAHLEQIIAEPLRFKAKLAIGEDAYTSMRMVNKARELWDVLGAAGTGAAVAKSSLVAGAFFAPSGLMGALGIGAAATPVGWVALAALASGGACYGLYRWLGDARASRVVEIPRFLNTPLDALGLALFDLIAPISLRLAAVDGQIEDAERQALLTHLVEEWGMDTAFVTHAITLIEPAAAAGSLDDMALELSKFLHANPDCNHAAVAKDLGAFLQEMLEAAGPLSEQEQAALQRTSSLIAQAPPAAWSAAWQSAREGALKGVRKASSTGAQAASVARQWTQERLPTQTEIAAATDRTLAQVKAHTASASSWAKDALQGSDQVKAHVQSKVRSVTDGLGAWVKRKKGT